MGLLEALIVILILAWALGGITVGGNAVHLLLLIVIILVLVKVFQGKNLL